MNEWGRRKAFPVFFAALLLSAAAGAAEAANIDPNNQGFQYAWGENVGWINFKPDQGPGVMVTSSAVTGFAWGENIGWINLNPVGGGVINDAIGHLSGFAWGENVGWINFAPDGGGVYIDQDGRFMGLAWGENIGWINFSVPFGVETDFRPMPAPMLTPLGILLSVVLLGLSAMYYLKRAEEAD